jgi:tetratricopeptide (TPR) repeat protein
MPPHYTQAELRNPDAQESLSNLYLMQATWQADSGERDKALNSLAEAATVAPFDRSSLHNAAVLYSQLGDWTASGDLLKQAYELAPNSFDSVLALGVFYGKTGQYDLCKDFRLFRKFADGPQSEYLGSKRLKLNC